VPYRIHTILTDNPILGEAEGGIKFAEQSRNRNTAWSRQMRYDMICEANDIEHRLTKPNALRYRSPREFITQNCEALSGL
jgi:hypothetical protein